MFMRPANTDFYTGSEPAWKITSRAVNVHRWDKHALRDVSLDIGRNQVTALIGPSGCGKATFLRCLNRANDYVEKCRVTGTILLDGEDIHHPDMDVVRLRAKVGMVSAKPNPFPKSIFENVAYESRLRCPARSRTDLEEIVFDSLERVGLLEDVKDRLDHPGLSLSIGQQQLLCIARVLAIGPEVILMDKPCSALDATATAKVEELIDALRSRFTIVIVTNPAQALRVSQRTVYFHLGEISECGVTSQIFTNPAHKLTQGYITGRFG